MRHCAIGCVYYNNKNSNLHDMQASTNISVGRTAVVTHRNVKVRVSNSIEYEDSRIRMRCFRNFHSGKEVQKKNLSLSYADSENAEALHLLIIIFI